MKLFFSQFNPFFLFISLCSFTLFLACNSRSEPKKIVPVETLPKQNIEKDTIYNYWHPETNTTVFKKELNIDSIQIKLKAKTYSLNDSSFVRILGSGNTVYIDHSHTIVTDLELKSDSSFESKRINRFDVIKGTQIESDPNYNLFKTFIDSLNPTKIYLRSEVAVPDTDDQWAIWYSIPITEKNNLGEIELLDHKYVGH